MQGAAQKAAAFHDHVPDRHALTLAIAFVDGPVVPVRLAGRSVGSEAIVGGFVAGLVAFGASRAGISRMTAARSPGTLIRTIAEQVVVAGVGVIRADAGKGRLVADFVGANVVVVAIGVRLAFTRVRRVFASRRFHAIVFGALDAVIAWQIGAVALAAGAHVRIGANQSVIAWQVGKNLPLDTQPLAIACGLGTDVAVGIRAGGVSGSVAGIIVLVTDIGAFRACGAGIDPRGVAAVNAVADFIAVAKVGIVWTIGSRGRRSPARAFCKGYIVGADNVAELRSIAGIVVIAECIIAGGA